MRPHLMPVRRGELGNFFRKTCPDNRSCFITSTELAAFIRCLFHYWWPMKNLWFFIAFLTALQPRAGALQANTPQAALEEIATADKPEILVRHLPEPVRKGIEALPKVAQQQVLQKLLEMKSVEMKGCTVRRTDEPDTWEIVDGEGQTRGKVRLANAFISGLDAMLRLQFETHDAARQIFIVTMHLDDDDWRIEDFGAWEKDDPGLRKLLHKPSETEENDSAANQTLQRLRGALYNYLYRYPESGYPHTLQSLTVPLPFSERFPASQPPLLEEAFAADPVISNGYEFRYLLTMPGGPQSLGSFQITASPVEFGKSGSRNYLMDEAGIHCTTENRPATVNDDCDDDE